MSEPRFTFTVEVRRADVCVRTATASVAPCVEDARFHAVLSGRIPNDGSSPDFTPVPAWGPAGPPAVVGLTLMHAGEPAGSYDLNVFAPTAYAIIRDLSQANVLAKDDVVSWTVAATAVQTAPPRFSARAVRSPYPLRVGRLPEAAPAEIVTEIEAGVIDDIRRTVVAAATVECAGLLVGHIVHDPERSAAALTITTQIPVPAGQGGASNTHFAFGPGSFRAAKQALNSFTNGCVSAGWWHSHPPCENCPQNPTCVADTVFFSPDDMQVHASAFSAAFAVALVAGKVRDRRALDPGFRLYGWQGGAIRERALRIASRSNTEMLRAAPVGAME